ncbi:glucosaminidase domain-containing protein [Pseudoalteromonas tunicata]|jgi:Bax protein|uniref:Mannosyl-glycoprotein endo-beta-N-acetylglucosamidase-like domain-containing protein n=1 Tax=Pseudoalteromonas tunicata D2 TaxID=87626 RepID=A4CAS8_9GAMM|nr:glucosaminidase domain-containing protein [Pseudoalteromonas tunicata]ATC95033.1 Bax protein [Pseudoalteromonas tunicata]AXT30687.1 glucosaminidase [Pseudoalteromonas tunicata]EAR28486.1 hypothetical protein PTD2_21762 [Pseudoalteromonas tunicata D2]MDP4983796.1 glucosaminidase domain-containing protein [Pseudoalteromonas tunicata]MDP5214053.1 glucosaminidase domain-containing protein [Pseudoalteromonas tunicata]
MLKSVLRVLAISFTLYCLVYPFINQPVKEVTESVTEPETVTEVVIVEEKPRHNVILPDFANIPDIKQKKMEFFSFIRPHVIAENKRISQQRAQLEIAKMMLEFDDVLSEQQLRNLRLIFKEYKVKQPIDKASITAALKRVDIVPEELVLMQAANESAWGTSRFARIGLNFFGQWCYQEGCGMVPLNRNLDAAHEVAVYESVSHAVAAYFRNINTNRAYRELRNIRSLQREQQEEPSAVELANGLLAYSERGNHYVEEIRDMIYANQEFFSE